jgi:hypothetical protein
MHFRCMSMKSTTAETGAHPCLCKKEVLGARSRRMGVVVLLFQSH